VDNSTFATEAKANGTNGRPNLAEAGGVETNQTALRYGEQNDLNGGGVSGYGLARGITHREPELPKSRVFHIPRGQSAVPDALPQGFLALWQPRRSIQSDSGTAISLHRRLAALAIPGMPIGMLPDFNRLPARAILRIQAASDATNRSLMHVSRHIS
jgi:hypothetical protein